MARIVRLLWLVSLATICGCVATSDRGKNEVLRYETGVVSFRAFRDSNSRFHGKVISYFQSGRVAEESYWDHGRPLRGMFYDEHGNVISEIQDGTGWRHCPEHSDYYHKGDYVRGQH